MNTRLAGTIFETGVTKPLLFCTGAVLLGTAMAMLQDVAVALWLIVTSEDIDVDIDGPDDLPLLPDLRGTA